LLIYSLLIWKNSHDIQSVLRKITAQKTQQYRFTGLQPDSEDELMHVWTETAENDNDQNET
jgi:hypothetical protein